MNHRGIIQTNNNTFKVTKRCCSCDKWFPIIYFSFSCLFASVVFWTEVNPGTIIFSILGFIFAILGLLMLCKSYHTAYFILNPNNIKVTEVAWCGRKSTIYGRGEINEIYFNSALSPGNKGEDIHIYEIRIVPSNPGKPNYLVFADKYKNTLYTEEEIGYFNYVMNHHIQTNMNMQNMN